MIQKKAVIIVAGGKGLRMQTDIPKQFIVINGLPILMHTILRFKEFDADMEIVLVLPKDHQGYWNGLCEEYKFKVDHKIASGGETRFHSVLNGLAAVEKAEIIGVHDGVRPLVSIETIERCYVGVLNFGAVIPVVDAVESIRQTNAEGSFSVDRSKYKMVQTPQVFLADLLRRAYGQDFSALFTDDASVVEAFLKTEKFDGFDLIKLVEGNRENIKITTKFDLLVAEIAFANGY